MTKPRGKILVIRGGAIGDFILTLPVFSALRQQFPQTRLEVLGYPHIAQLALAGGLVDEVRPIESRALAGFFAGHGSLDSNLAEYFNSFSIIISYLYDPDRIFHENVARVSKAQFIVGPHRPDETRQRHERMKKTVGGLQESLDYLRLSIKYLVFDLEATRRENGYLRKMLEEAQGQE